MKWFTLHVWADLFPGDDFFTMEHVFPFKKCSLTFKACIFVFPLAESWSVAASEDKIEYYFYTVLIYRGCGTH